MTDVTDATIISETVAPAPAAPNPLAGLAGLVVPTPQELLRSPSTLKRAAELAIITDAQDREFAVDELREIKAAKDELERRRLTVSGPLHQAKVAFDAMFAEPKAMLDAADEMLRGKVTSFDRAEREREAEARRKAEAEAAEQRRLAAEAAAKLQAEADARASALRQAAEAAAAAGDYGAAAAQEMAAVNAQAEGTVAVAQVEAATFAAPAIPAAAPKKTGTSTREKWGAQLEDESTPEAAQASLLKIIRHVAAHPEHIGLLDFNASGAAKLAGALKTALVVPGMRVTRDDVLAVRKAK